MRIIDMHTHAWPDAVAVKAVPALVDAGGGLTAHYDGTVAGLESSMARTGVAVSVVQPVATKPSQVGPINDWVAGQASPRIVPFGAMHPDLEDPAAEIARMTALGLKEGVSSSEATATTPSRPVPIVRAPAGIRIRVFTDPQRPWMRDRPRSP